MRRRTLASECPNREPSLSKRAREAVPGSLESRALERAPQPEAESSGSAAGARLVLALAALAAFLPAVPGWTIARGYHAIPRLPVAEPVRVHETAPGAPPLVGAEAVAAAPDGTLFVADHALRHVVALKTGAPGRWLPRRGASGRGSARTASSSSSTSIRASLPFRCRRDTRGRAAVAPPGSSPALCLARDGRVLVAAAGAIRRFASGPLGGRPVVGAGSGTRSRAATSRASPRAASASGRRRDPGSSLVWSAAGALVGSTPLVGNAGALEVAPGGRLVLAETGRQGRLFLLDARGADGRPARLSRRDRSGRVSGRSRARPDGRLAVAEGPALRSSGCRRPRGDAEPVPGRAPRGDRDGGHPGSTRRSRSATTGPTSRTTGRSGEAALRGDDVYAAHPLFPYMPYSQVVTALCVGVGELSGVPFQVLLKLVNLLGDVLLAVGLLLALWRRAGPKGAILWTLACAPSTPSRSSSPRSAGT